MEKVIFYMIIGLVCLLVIFIFLSGNLPALTENRQLIPESLVKITGEPLISYSENDNYEYTIAIPAEIEYTGKWEMDNKAIDSVDVVSLVSFKGIDKKASVDGKDTFTLTKDSPTFEGELSAVVKSYAGPMIKLTESSYDGGMKMHESILLTTEDDGNFLVTFDDCSTVKVGWIAGSIYGSPKFTIECGTESRSIRLLDWYFCEEGEFKRNYNKCERYLEFCDGNIHIKLVGDTRVGITYEGFAYCGTNRVIMEAKGGKPFEPGERVEVSFWRSSECVGKYNTFDELLSNCARDFLGYAPLKGE